VRILRQHHRQKASDGATRDTYCIVCKEEQERQEKMFQKKRQMRATMEF